MDDSERALRGEIVRACLEMDRRGINQGTSGNVSVRWGDGLLVTPSGLPYETMAPEDVVHLAMDGTPTGRHKPSSEWRFHRDILRERPDLQAVVHAHPPYCTGMAILNRDVPAVHYMIAAVGGPTLRCADYATFGTEELSREALAALEGRTACLLANHGLIACGPSLGRALWLAQECETLCRQYAIATMVGEPVVLPDEEIATCVERFKSYGPRREEDEPAEPEPRARRSA
jgi:L-fuculose-phosphate aldolase